LWFWTGAKAAAKIIFLSEFKGGWVSNFKDEECLLLCSKMEE